MGKYQLEEAQRGDLDPKPMIAPLPIEVRPLPKIMEVSAVAENECDPRISSESGSVNEPIGFSWNADAPILSTEAPSVSE